MIKFICFGVFGVVKFVWEFMVCVIYVVEGVELVVIVMLLLEKVVLFQVFCLIFIVYDSYDVLLVDLIIDVVYILLLNYFYVEWMIKVFEVGKYVFCEKLIVMFIDEYEWLIVVWDVFGKLVVEVYMIVYYF